MILKENELWYIIDSSKLKVMMDCPRQFFYRHILGWDTTMKSRNDLSFGAAWHKSMAYLGDHNYSAENTLNAYNEFLTEYRKSFTEDEDLMFPKKTPARARLALAAYTAIYSDDPSKYKTLYTEVGGTVTVHPELPPLHYRIDNISEELDTGLKRCFERKTGSNYSNSWAEQWQLSVQTGTYLHTLYSLYDEKEVGALWIDGVFFSAKDKAFGPDNFKRIKVQRSKEHMQVWLWNTVNWIDSIMREIQYLIDCSPDASIMHAFPQNGESCTKYFGCPYLDLCTSWPNPLKHCEVPPIGFEVSFWDPRITEIKQRLDI